MEEIQPGESVTTAAPPPSEVKIRTMKSDIAMLLASGGGMPRFESVKVAGLAAAERTESPTNVAKQESKSNLALIVVFVVLVIALLLVGWFVYLKLHA